MTMLPSEPLMSESEFPKDGILWRSYDAAIDLLNERTRPMLSFVVDYD